MIKNKKIAFFGCKHTTKECITNFLSDIGEIDYLIIINEEQALKNQVAGYINLLSFAKENGIEVYSANNYSLNNSEDVKWINNKKIDIAFSIGWQRLIPSEILNEISIGIFGMHGSAYDLPRGRGRSPMNWALILDKKEFYTNLFKYEDSIDGGNIVDTQKFDINFYDTIETLHYKNTISMYKLIKKNLNNIVNNNINFKKQNKKNATYYPKRNPNDGAIDWDLKTKHIYNLCRALTKPFPGAFTYINDIKILIWELLPFSDILKYNNAKPGEIVEVFNNKKFIVKTKDSTVLITKYEIEKPDLLKKGKILKIVNYQKIYEDIEKRYPDFVEEKQKEITLKKITSFYKYN